MRYTRLSFLLVVLSVSLSFLFIPYPLWSKEVSQSSPDSDPTATRFIIGVDIVNIREQPNLSSRVKYRLKSGDSVAVKDKEGEWYRVAFEKKKNGWVHENLLAANTETTKLEATTTTPPETPSGTFSDPSDASQEYPLPNPLWSKEVSQSSPDSDPTATRFIIGVDIVNIREQPNLSSPVKYRLKSGDSVAVKDKEGEWYRVAFEKKKNGWVHENLLATNTETTKPEATTTTPPETPSGTFSDPSDASQEYPLPSVMQWHRENPGKFVLVAEGTFLYSLSDLEGSDALSGGDIQGVISPSIQMDEKSYFSFIYNGQYYKRREFYSDDIGYLERSEYQGHTFTAQISRNFGERNRFTITPSFFYTQTLNKDGEETSWDGGLYNYRDTGWGLDFMAEDVGFAGAMGTFQIGAQIYAREYPNYDSLLDLATGLGTEKDEKDYHGVLFRTGYSWLQQAGFSWTANYSMLFKFLDDKKVVDENGLLSDDEQRDHLHTLDFNVWYLSNLGLKAGLITTLGLNKSNQNWYDGMGTVPLDDDVFIPDFYDYFVYRLRPNISYTFGAFGLFPFTATYAFAYGETLYTDRRAKYADGTYKPDEQKDKAWENFLELRYDYNRRVSFIGQFQHITNRSNNDDESFYRYNFRIYNYYAGVHLRY